MSEVSATPQRVNSAMLESMSQINTNAGSSMAIGSGGGGKGMGASIGGDETIGDFLSKQNIDSLFGHSGVDSLFDTAGALGRDPFSDAFDGSHSPFGISHGGFNISSELSNANLSQATSLVSNLNAKIPSLISSGQGQEH